MFFRDIIMDHNLSFGQDPLETSSLPISLFDNHLSSFSNDDTVYGILAYIAAVVLLVYALIYGIVLLLRPRPRQAFPSEHTYITNDESGSVSSPRPLHFTSEYLTIDELQSCPTLFRPKPSNTFTSPEKSKSLGLLQTDYEKETNQLPYESNNIELSVIVPCYNETKRLHLFLEDAVPVLDSLYSSSTNQSSSSSSSSLKNQADSSTLSPKTQKQFGSLQSATPRWEILLVDDGSSDGTAEYAIEWAAAQHKAGKYHMPPGTLRVSKLEQNRGKGGAVTHGMLHVRGKCSIFADADGASRFDDVRRLLNSIKEHAAKSGHSNNQYLSYPVVAIGSRAHMVSTDAVVKRSFIRNLLMYGLHVLVFIFGIRTIGDTQCGFKMYTRTAILQIFPYMHTEGWIFDVETLIIAMRAGIPVIEVPISWHEVAGSKVELAKDSIKMAIDLVVTRLAYVMGLYTDGVKQTKRAKEMVEAGQSVKME